LQHSLLRALNMPVAGKYVLYPCDSGGGEGPLVVAAVRERKGVDRRFCPAHFCNRSAGMV
jgi:hypothetical protein